MELGVFQHVRIHDLNCDVETCPRLQQREKFESLAWRGPHIQLFENTIFVCAKLGPRAVCRMRCASFLCDEKDGSSWIRLDLLEESLF